MPRLFAGFAKTDITPESRRQTIYHVSGQSLDEEVPVRDRLYARATAFRSGHETAVWVSADLLCITSDVRDRVMELLAPHGLVPRQVVLGATHTHTAPSLVNFHGRAPTPEPYVGFLVEELRDVILEAIEALRPASLNYGTSTVGLGVNRRESGRMTVVNDLQYPPGDVNPIVHVLRVEVEGSGAAGLLFSYTAHPLTMLKNVPQISADFVGRAVGLLEEEDEVAFAQFSQGCCGSTNVKIHGDTDERDLAGQMLAEAVRAAALQPVCMDGGLNIAHQTVRLPWSEIPSLEEAREKRKLALARKDAHTYPAVRTLEWAEALVRALKVGEVAPFIEVSVQALRLGDMVLVALPGEVFHQTGQRIQQACGAHRLVPIGYCNSCEVGYIPPAEAYPEGGYEVDGAPYYYGLFQLDASAEATLAAAAVRLVRNIL